MEYKKGIMRVLFLSILGFIIALVITSPSYFGLCPANDKFCLDPFDELFGQSLGIFSLLFILLSPVLLFLKEQIFIAWKKFAIIYVPISMVLIAIASPRGDMFFPSMQETLIFLLPGIFILASLYIIISKSLKLRGTR